MAAATVGPMIPAAPQPPASRHVSQVIRRPSAEVYAFAADPRNLPRWALGLAGSDVRREAEAWSMDSPMGRVLVRFAPPNELGVLDHVVTLADGTAVLNPMRVLALGDGASEIVFTVRQDSPAALEDDAAAVAADLVRLRDLLESAD